MNEMQQFYDRTVRPIEDRMIRSIWRIVRNPDDAEDAMQEALLTISRRWDRIRRHAAPQPLILKICIDAAYDATRRRMRRRILELEQSSGEPLDPLRSAEDRMAAAEQHTEILTAIHRLSRQQAVATLMRLVQGQSYEQLAAALECTEATARKHVARGRERLRVWLAHLDPTSQE